MSRATEYKFVSTDSTGVITELTARYEELTERTLLPSDPDKLFIQWVAGIIIQQRILINYAANQNIPSRAEGENLDALGEMLYNVSRPEAVAAVCMERFTLTSPRTSAVIIPKGTEITDADGALKWRTTAETVINAGELSADAPIECETVGTIGNGYAAGQLCRLTDADAFSFDISCANTVTTNSGAETASDDEYYELMRAGMEAFSTAGPKGAYEYHAKAVSNEIADVCVTAPADKAGYVNIFAVMENGEPADDGTKAAILAACNADTVRPLTDAVEVLDPETADFTIKIIYYTDSAAEVSANEVDAAVRAAAAEYALWQCSKIGRDINPSRLMWLLKDSGAKRAEIVSPVFTALRDGADGLTPQLAHTSIENAEIINGGSESD